MNILHHSRDAEQLLAQAGLLAAPAAKAIDFYGLSNNSKETVEGDLFLCKGFNFKPEYLKMAAESGAVAYMGEAPVSGADLPFIQVTDIRKAQSLLAIWYYAHPSEALTLIGITGTKGKTTTAYDLKAILDGYAKMPTGLISTVERFVGDAHEPSHLTTPESLDLQGLLSRARENRLPFVTMEVSSQAYKMERVFGQRFRFGVFLNFGADHICAHEHPDLEDYFACKLRLMENCDTAVICRETDRFDRIYAAAKANAKKVCVVGLEDPSCDYTACAVQKEPTGYRFSVTEKGAEGSFPYRILQEGRFNVENALTAIAIGRELKIPHSVMAEALEKLAVPGRMNLLTGDGVRVLVDYAHNKLSFEALFRSLQKDYPGAKITVVAGAPGERAEARRTDIGTLCGRYADRVIFTADDPGFEDPEKICQEMAAAAAPYPARVSIICDRAKAVEEAVATAEKGAVVILAGKGHEVSQRVNGVYQPYESDAAIARRVLDRREGRI